MASVTKFEFQVELKSPAEALWNSVKDMNFIYPKLFPKVYESIEILEGDGKSTGTIRLVTLSCDSHRLGKTQKSKIEYVDEEKKAVGYLVLEGAPLKLYNYYHESITVKPKGKGSVMVWCCTFDKKFRVNPGPEVTKVARVEEFKKLDAYTVSQYNNNNNNIKS